MTRIETLLHRLKVEEPSDSLRQEVVDLIGETLSALKPSLGYWEKVHIAEAIAWVHANAAQRPQPTRAWLRIALVTLDKATTPASLRNESYTHRVEEIEALHYEDLANLLRQLGAQVR